MRRALGFGLGAVAATCISTVCAFAPISRLLSKIGGDEFWMAKHLFAREVLPSMAVGIALVMLALWAACHRPILAILILLFAPIAVLLTDLLLLALHL